MTKKINWEYYKGFLIFVALGIFFIYLSGYSLAQGNLSDANTFFIFGMFFLSVVFLSYVEESNVLTEFIEVNEID